MENREIKFRAWDKINNVMHNNIWSINWDFAPKEPKALLTSIASNDVINSEYILRKPNFILQQFTGLKDKNGKEIYEGDFVTGNWLIKFDGGMFIPFYDFGRQERYEDVGYEWWNKVEVIGNISENKDLMSKEEF